MRRFALVIFIILFMIPGCSQINQEKVSGKRFGESPRDAREFVTPASVQQYDGLETAWNALENGYVYSVDNWYLTDMTGQSIPGGKDTWLFPIETQYLINTYPASHAMDCEDGSAWLASEFKKMGYDAWFCVGTIEIDGTQYGHAWVMVFIDGEWSTYETTVGDVKPGLPCIYSLAWRTNGIVVWSNLVFGAPEYLDPLPNGLVFRLKETLHEL